MMLELVEQNQLVQENSPQNDQLGTPFAFDRDLSSPFKDIFEQAVERLDRLMAEAMKDASDFDTGIGVWIGSAPRSDQETIREMAMIADFGCIVVIVTQHEARFQG